MSNIKKLMVSAAGGDILDVDDVFSTYLYTGNSTARSITNGVDLSGEGGLVWIKWRAGNNAFGHSLHDTERGVTQELHTDATAAQSTENRISSFDSTGFSLTNNTETNLTANDYASWTFRKAPKFFDVVTYTGNGNDNRTVNHNLGSSPGMVIVKKTDAADSWIVWHRSVPTGYLSLNVTSGLQNYTSRIKSANDTTFTLGTSGQTNSSGANYVAYVFAHNDGDGEFGPDGDQDIIKCGGYTGNGSSTGPVIDLGFEPQWLLVKSSSFDGGPWYMVDAMRGFGSGINNAYMYANGANAEFNDYELFRNTGQGFQPRENFGVINGSGQSYIYMAIRRGSLFPPESATEVFAIDTYGSTGDGKAPALRSPFAVDMYFQTEISGTDNKRFRQRLHGNKFLYSSANNAQSGANSSTDFAFNNGVFNYTNTLSNNYGWMWKRAPGFFDVVSYEWNGVATRNVEHNLGVPPEMYIVKNIKSTDDWYVRHSLFFGTNGSIQFNRTNAKQNSGVFTTSGTTATTFPVANDGSVNAAGGSYIAYLFATLDGVSKVGSYTGTTAAQTIDCGFTAGARFVLIKNTSSSGGGWFVFDTERGITTTSNDGLLYINSTQQQYTEAYALGYNAIEPDNSGFKMTGNNNSINKNGETYIFYAIA